MEIVSKIRNYRKIISNALQMEGENKYIFVWTFQLIIWYTRNTGGIIEFFLLKLNKKGNNLNAYLTEKLFKKTHNELNRIYHRILLEDKYAFDRILTAEEFPLAQMQVLVEHGNVWLLGKQKVISLNRFLENDISCFCKMYVSCGGKDIFKLDIVNGDIYVDNMQSTKSDLKKLFSTGRFVLQKTISQHEELNKLNANCVNTLRIITIDSGDKVFVLGSFIRIGVGKSVVDNTAQGNLVCGINYDGTLFKEASDHLSDKKWITQHPDNGFVFEGFKIPYFTDSETLCILMHQAFHRFFIIGWDIAITDTGPVVIEGNPLNDLLWLQILYGPIKDKFLRCAEGYRREYPDRT